jgi:ADP-ribose pyrophosphatase YjhB (NUDIX family)
MTQRTISGESRFWVAVDTVIFTLCDRDLKTLLVRRDHDPFIGYWALPGGLVRDDESLEDAALRQLAETLNVGDVYCQQLYTFGDPNRDTRRVISVTYFALVSQDRLPPDSLKDTSGRSAWHSLYHLPKLAFDHADILNYALTRLRYKIEYSAVAFELMPEEFTLRELQEAYMIILNDHKLDKANFRKKIREANIVEPISRFRETGGRPAKLYRFRKDAQLESKARRFFP